MTATQYYGDYPANANANEFYGNQQYGYQSNGYGNNNAVSLIKWNSNWLFLLCKNWKDFFC